MTKMSVVRYKYIIGIVVAIALVGLTACDGKDSQKQSDIPDRRIYNHSDTLALEARKTGDFNRVLAVIDSLVNAGEMSPIQAANYQCEAYFMLGQSEKSMDCLRRATADNNPPAEDFWVYINCGMHLAMLQEGLHDRDGAITTALRFIKELQQVKSPYRARTLKSLYYFLGKTQMTLGRHDEAVESFNEAYRWLKLNIEIDSTGGMMPNAMLTLENTASAYLGINQPNEAERWVNREDSLLAVYRQSPEADSTQIEFYRAFILLDRAKICQSRGQEAEAARYYAEYTKTDRGKSIEGYMFGTNYLMAAHRYADAADVYQQLDHYLGSYGFDYDLETIGKDMLPKFRANYNAGRKDTAMQVALKIAEVYDSALVIQNKSDAAKLATIYEMQGKERQIAEQRAGKRLFTAISIAVGILALLILAFAVYVFRQWRTTKEKNRILARQITEALEYKEKYREQKKIQAPTDDSTGGTGVSISDLTTLSDEQLFICLRDLIESERLFLQSDFGRQTLIDHTGLSKERIGAAFSQGSDSVSLPAYVRELRLDYAVRLMNDQPDIAVEQVSQASGFTSADTFTRNFRAKYGMTPTAYKQTKV